MTVRELINKLEELDPDLKVFVQGYEAGYDYANPSHEMEFVLDYHTHWYYGRHEEASVAESRDQIKEFNKVRGIVL